MRLRALLCSVASMYGHRRVHMDSGAASVPVAPGFDAQLPRSADAGGAVAAAPMPGQNCLEGSGNFTANGPYRVKQKDVTIGSQGPYTLFSPDPRETARKHPIVARVNGTAVTGSDIYANWQGGDRISTATLLGFITGKNL